MISFIFFILMAGFVYLRWLPLEILVVYLATSAIAFLLYGRDKSAAQKGAWRISERTLHIFGLIGGWPGALLAQRMFHHKSRKSSFQRVFWLTIIINCSVLAWAIHASIF